jgi:hypothetical protein
MLSGWFIAGEEKKKVFGQKHSFVFVFLLFVFSLPFSLAGFKGPFPTNLQHIVGLKNRNEQRFDVSTKGGVNV